MYEDQALHQRAREALPELTKLTPWEWHNQGFDVVAGVGGETQLFILRGVPPVNEAASIVALESLVEPVLLRGLASVVQAAHPQRTVVATDNGVVVDGVAFQPVLRETLQAFLNKIREYFA